MTINHIVSIDHGSCQDIHASFLWKKTQVVGGLEHEWIIFPFSWECHKPN